MNFLDLYIYLDDWMRIFKHFIEIAEKQFLADDLSKTRNLL